MFKKVETSIKIIFSKEMYTGVINNFVGNNTKNILFPSIPTNIL